MVVITDLLPGEKTIYYRLCASDSGFLYIQFNSKGGGSKAPLRAQGLTADTESVGPNDFRSEFRLKPFEEQRQKPADQ